MCASEPPRPAKAGRIDRWIQALDDGISRGLYWFSHHWLAVITVLIGLMVGLPLLAPALMAAGLEPLGRALHALYYPSCHQMPQRSFFLFGPQLTYSLDQLAELIGGTVPARFVGIEETGYKMAICERCTGVYSGMLLSAIGFGLYRHTRPISFWVLVPMLAWMVVDGTAQLLGLYTTGWEVRFLNGALFGAAAILATFPYLEAGMRDIVYHSTVSLEPPASS
ncbi:MAG: DUF2085 domain-containing protein [Chloroflexi bacterium]|nr:DUF2085 domain-containing protein [Chloroflexota bacterium]